MLFRSDAYNKGVEDGDILISINNSRITTMEEMKAAIYELEVGTTVNTIIYRGGQQYLLELTLTEDKG